MSVPGSGERAAGPTAAGIPITALIPSERESTSRSHDGIDPAPPAPESIGPRVVLVGMLLGAALPAYLEVRAESGRALWTPGGPLVALGRLAGLTGAYLLLVMVVLLARVPALERMLGYETLVRWHRRIGSWPIALIAIHIVFIAIGYGELDRAGPFREFVRLLTSFPDVMAALVGFGLLLAGGITSWRAVRRRLPYGAWWTVHLYLYLALALSLSHQLANGASFVHDALDRVYWIALWLATAGFVLAYRVALPLGRSLHHDLRVIEVSDEGADAVSVVVGGRDLDRLAARGGQFFLWRFLSRGCWYEGHPFSISKMPTPDTLRVTVRASGDHSGALQHVAPGTRVVIEGPYGSFTRQLQRTAGVCLIGAGIGVTPIRALLEDLAPDLDVTVVLRFSTAEERYLRDEMATIIEARGGVLHELVGPRDEVMLDDDALVGLVPDVTEHDVYVCGPEGFRAEIVASLGRLGTPAGRIHEESFLF